MQKELTKQRYCTQQEQDLLFHRVRQLEQEDITEFRTYWVRVHVMLNVVFSCGLRVSEAKNILHRHLDLHSDYPSVFILGKRRLRRYVPLSKQLVDHLKLFIKFKESQSLDVSPGAYLLPSMKYPAKPMSVSALEMQFLKAMEMAGLPRKTIHSARHSFGFRVYNATSDLRATQQLLGHSSLQSVECYTYCQFDKLSGIVNEIQRR